MDNDLATLDVMGSDWATFDYELPEMEEREGPYELPWVEGCPVAPLDFAGAKFSKAFRRAKPPWKDAVYVHEYQRRIPNKPYGKPEVDVMEHYRHAVSGAEAVEDMMYAAAADALDAYAGAIVEGVEPYTEVGSIFGDIVSSVSSAVSSVAQAVTSPIVPMAQAIAKPFTPVMSALVAPLQFAAKNIIAPVVATATSAAKTMVAGIRKFNPVAIAKFVAAKAKAVAGSLKDSVVVKMITAVGNKALAPALTIIKAAGPVLPYVTSVVSFVPGVGTGVGAALGAAQAIADGRPITEIMMAGVRNAIPGGAIAKIAFDATRGIVQGKRIDTIALDALRGQLPAAATKAMDFGLAMAAAKTAQDKRETVKKNMFASLANTVAKKIAA